MAIERNDIWLHAAHALEGTRCAAMQSGIGSARSTTHVIREILDGGGISALISSPLPGKKMPEISMGTDAHGPSQLRFMELGVAAVIRTKLDPKTILNYMPTDQLLEWAATVRDHRHQFVQCRETILESRKEHPSPTLAGATKGYSCLVGDFVTCVRRKIMRAMPSPLDDNELRLPGRRAWVKSAVLTAASAMALPSRARSEAAHLTSQEALLGASKAKAGKTASPHCGRDLATRTCVRLHLVPLF
jgi:hypothetical protein